MVSRDTSKAKTSLFVSLPYSLDAHFIGHDRRLADFDLTELSRKPAAACLNLQGLCTLLDVVRTLALVAWIEMQYHNLLTATALPWAGRAGRAGSPAPKAYAGRPSANKFSQLFHV